MSQATMAAAGAALALLQRYWIDLPRGRYEVILISDGLALVSSRSDSQAVHSVQLADQGRCDCEGWRWRRSCSHLSAVRALQALAGEGQQGACDDDLG